jgi:putative ABC transport system permease protein
MVFGRKAVNDSFGQEFFLVVKDTAVMDKLRGAFSATETNDRILTIRMNMDGPDNNKEDFIRDAIDWSSVQKGYNSFINGIVSRRELLSMDGRLLFIGIFFSIIFTMCLILIMYYKQITKLRRPGQLRHHAEGSMSDAEVKSTIRKQILLVFFSPLIVALLHTMAGFNMILGLLSTLNLFNTDLIIMCGLIVTGFFAVLYGLSYSFTSRTYYRIVKQMNDDETARPLPEEQPAVSLFLSLLLLVKSLVMFCWRKNSSEMSSLFAIKRRYEKCN